MLLDKEQCVSRAFSAQQEFMSAMRTMRVGLLVAVFAFVCVALPAGTAHADVTYQGKAHTFSVQGADGRPVDDLFSNFKNVMPGDTLTQQVTITNNGMNTVPAKLYLRSTGVLAGSTAFLSLLRLSVTPVDAGNGSRLFDAPPSQTASLADWMCLGTFAPGAHVTLNLVLQVPLTMDNEFQDASGTIGWEFMAEEMDGDDSSGDSGEGGGDKEEGDSDQDEGGSNEDEDPGTNKGTAAGSPLHFVAKTGDSLNVVPFAVVALIALAVATACRSSRR